MIFNENAEWLKNRLQSMGPAEVISRVADVGRHLALRSNLNGIQRARGKRPGKHGSYRSPETRDQLNTISTPSRNAIIAAANQWLDHRAAFFSLKDIPLGDLIDWHRDYSSGMVGPIRYSGLINPRDRSKVGDIKY